MGKYGIGARVRDKDGDTGTVVDKEKGRREVRYDSEAFCNTWWSKSELTPLPAASTEWQPKVGQRVLTHGRGHGYTQDIGFISGVDDDGDCYVEFHDGWSGGHEGNKSDGAKSRWFFVREEIEPAPLTIVAGCYYKTRDGRKVLVSAYTYGTHYPFYHDGGYDGYHAITAEGKSCINADESDIVSEWVDQPAEPVAPKFKIGDRVRIVRNNRGEYLDREIGKEFTITNSDGPGNVGWSGTESIYWWEESELEPVPTTTQESHIVCRLTSSGKPRPNARPVVHATLAAAEAEAQRLADRFGDEFAVYSRGATKSIDAGPIPRGWNITHARAALDKCTRKNLAFAFVWSDTPGGFLFWSDQHENNELTPKGRAILTKWIAKAEVNEPA